MNLSPSERKVLVDLLLNGDDGSGNISERTGVSRKHVSSNCLPALEEANLVEDKGRGNYTLTLEGVAAARAIRRGH